MVEYEKWLKRVHSLLVLGGSCHMSVAPTSEQTGDGGKSVDVSGGVDGGEAVAVAVADAAGAEEKGTALGNPLEGVAAVGGGECGGRQERVRVVTGVDRECVEKTGEKSVVTKGAAKGGGGNDERAGRSKGAPKGGSTDAKQRAPKEPKDGKDGKDGKGTDMGPARRAALAKGNAAPEVVPARTCRNPADTFTADEGGPSIDRALSPPTFVQLAIGLCPAPLYVWQCATDTRFAARSIIMAVVLALVLAWHYVGLHSSISILRGIRGAHRSTIAGAGIMLAPLPLFLQHCSMADDLGDSGLGSESSGSILVVRSAVLVMVTMAFIGCSVVGFRGTGRGREVGGWGIKRKNQ